jgi:hypothetical protein
MRAAHEPDSTRDSLEGITTISRSGRYECCRCAATRLYVGVFMLLLVGLDYAAGDALSALRLPLIAAAGAAFVLMIISVAIAIRIEGEAGAGESDAATLHQSRPPPRHKAAQASVPRPGT